MTDEELAEAVLAGLGGKSELCCYFCNLKGAFFYGSQVNRNGRRYPFCAKCVREIQTKHRISLMDTAAQLARTLIYREEEIGNEPAFRLIDMKILGRANKK